MITALTAIGALVFTGLALNATRDQVAAARQQNDLAQQGQFADRHAKAVEQLDQPGPEHLQSRVAGIYALQRLAVDSPRDQPTIINVLITFITSTTQRATTGHPSCPERIAPDIQAAITVLNDHNRGHTAPDAVDRGMVLPKACLNRGTLNRVTLARANLAETHLTGANLIQVGLIGANLTGANLVGATLTDADLSWANLTGADLTRATLRKAELTRANSTAVNLTGADLTRANLIGAKLTGANLTGADLTGANLTGAKLIGVDLTGANLDGATLTRADLRGADLTDTRHAGTLVDGVIIDSTIKGKWWGSRGTR